MGNLTIQYQLSDRDGVSFDWSENRETHQVIVPSDCEAIVVVIAIQSVTGGDLDIVDGDIDSHDYLIEDLHSSKMYLTRVKE